MRDLKGKQFKKDIILVAVGYYCRFSLSYRDISEILKERGISVRPTTIMRWIHQYGPQLEEKVRHHLKSTNDSWRFDETYIKVNQEITKPPSAFSYVSKPRVITVDKNPTYPVAIQALKEEKHMPEGIWLRQVRYFNHIVEQDYRFIKKLVRSMLGFRSFGTAISILAGVEVMHMIKKEQIDLRD
nr:DDE-type integrase/transposase/recombinase [Bacillus mycoides]